jgi:threonine dehydrogenase-like Zn-dependent dehydrogenase
LGVNERKAPLQGITFRYSMPRFAFARLAGLLTPRAYVSFAAPTQLSEIPEPMLLGDDWVILRLVRCGICGSDIKQVFMDAHFDNPLICLISFPQVLGHEAVGVIEQVGASVSTRRVGERVVVNPWLSCGPRHIEPPCDACQRGQYPLCAHFTDGALPPGMHAGNNRAVTGGFAPFMAAHQSQVIPIPQGVSFDEAVLADPFAVSLHAILKAPPAPGKWALVYGAGVLGLLSVAALRVLFPETRVAVVARYDHQAQLAAQMGAECIIRARNDADVIEQVAGLTGAQVYRPPRTLPWLLRGVDVIYDTVGTPQTLAVGVRVANPRAPIVITGVGAPARFEWTPLYFKEVELIGSNAFGIEEVGGVRAHAMEHYLRLVAEGAVRPLPLITHHVSLDQYRDAFLMMHSKARHRAVKAVFDFAPGAA